jgi:hypothetical protein
MSPSVSVERYQASLSDPDQATKETIEVMCQQIATAAEDSAVEQTAREACEQFRGGPIYADVPGDPLADPRRMACSLFWWAKHNLKFVQHAKMIEALFNERDQLQLLIDPRLIVRGCCSTKGWSGKPEGDCAIFTTVLCSMLKALGIGYEIVTVAVEPDQPQIFSHVYPRAILPDGTRITLDAGTRHRTYPGWEIPASRKFRAQVWDECGNPVYESRSGFHGLHDYVPVTGFPWPLTLRNPNFPWASTLRDDKLFSTGRGGAGRGVQGFRGRRGMGQDDSEGGINVLPSSSTSDDTSAAYLAALAGTTPGDVVDPTTQAYLNALAGSTPGDLVPSSMSSSGAASTGYAYPTTTTAGQIAQVLSSLGTPIATALGVQTTQPTVLGISASGLLMLGLVIGGALLLVAFMGKK